MAAHSSTPQLFEYLTRSHKVLLFDKGYDACAPFGFFNGQRVKTPKGAGTCVGVHTTPAGERQMWFHVDGQDGASFWDNGTDYDSLVRDVGVEAIDPPPAAPAAAVARGKSSNSDDGLTTLESSKLDQLTGMFSQLAPKICLDTLRAADGDVNRACERLLTLGEFQNQHEQQVRPTPGALTPTTTPAPATTPTATSNKVVVTAPATPTLRSSSPPPAALSSSTDTVGESDDEEDAEEQLSAKAARDEHLARQKIRDMVAEATEAAARSHTARVTASQTNSAPATPAASQQPAAAAATATTRPALRVSTGDEDLDDAMLVRMKALQEENARVEAEKRKSMEWCIAQVEKSRLRLKEREQHISRLETENAQLRAEVGTLRAKQDNVKAKAQALLDDHIKQLTMSFAELVTDDNNQ